MSDQQPNRRPEEAFDDLIGNATASAAGSSFRTALRGYDKEEVDAAIAGLTARLRAGADEIAFLEERHRRATEGADSQTREVVQRIQADFDGKLAAANAHNRDTVERLKNELATKVEAAEKASREQIQKLEGELALAEKRAATAEAKAHEDAGEAEKRNLAAIERLEGELAATKARATKAEQRVHVLTEELVDGANDAANRPRFEEILRVAEEQASVIIRNASIQADRLLEAAREEVQNRRKEVQAEAEAILSQAETDAKQARLKIETELTAHQARLERETAHAAEKVAQAEQEAAAIRSEAERGAASLRSMVARETSEARAEAEEAVREQRMRALELEESLTRRQDDAQQEFLMLHNQAVAHAERITLDANEQVAASLEHAQRVSSKADDFDRLMRAQAAQIEADSQVRAREHLDRAREKAQRIIDTVTQHSQSVLRDAEDRTRQLRWQQHQLTSFMAEVRELIRPEGALGRNDDETAEAFASTDAGALGAEGAEFAAVDAPAYGELGSYGEPFADQEPARDDDRSGDAEDAPTEPGDESGELESEASGTDDDGNDDGNDDDDTSDDEGDDEAQAA